MNPAAKKMTYGIMLALVAWGIYLAIGVTGIFVQDSMFDLRKSLIVIVCMALFLGLWWVVLLGQPKITVTSTIETTEEPKTQTSSAISWSRGGIATVIWGVNGIAMWTIAIATWKSVGTSVTTIFGWSAAFCILASATSGIMALSDPKRRTGKWLGLLGLLGFGVCLIGFLARMTP